MRANRVNDDFYCGSERYGTYYQNPVSFVRKGRLGPSFPSLVQQFQTNDSVQMAEEIRASDTVGKR